MYHVQSIKSLFSDNIKHRNLYQGSPQEAPRGRSIRKNIFSQIPLRRFTRQPEWKIASINQYRAWLGSEMSIRLRVHSLECKQPIGCGAETFCRTMDKNEGLKLKCAHVRWFARRCKSATTSGFIIGDPPIGLTILHKSCIVVHTFRLRQFLAFLI